MKCVCVYILIYSSSLGNWNSSQNLDPSHKNVGVSLVTQLVKNLTAMQETQFDSQVRKIHWRRDRLPTAVFLRFPCGSAGKESVCNLGATNAGEDVEQSRVIAWGSVEWCSHFGRQFSSFLQTKHSLTIPSSSHTPWYVPRWVESICLHTQTKITQFL